MKIDSMKFSSQCIIKIQYNINILFEFLTVGHVSEYRFEVRRGK